MKLRKSSIRGRARGFMCLLAVMAAAAALLAGCGAIDPDYANADLASLEVSGYPLDAAFDPEVLSYVVMVPADTATVAVSADAESPQSTLSLSAPVPSAVPLASGPNVVTVRVTARKTSIFKEYKLTVYRCNTAVQVLDSLGGSLLPPAGISYRVYDGSTLVETFRVPANPHFIWVGTDKPYRVVASVEGRASDAREAVRAAAGAGNSISFYSQKSGMSSFQATAPAIDAFEFTTATNPESAEASWSPVEGATLDMAIVTGFRAKVSSVAEVDPTSWSGTGIVFGIDFVPVELLYMPMEEIDSTWDEASSRFRTTAIFTAGGISLTAGSHQVIVVAYDRANNRIQRAFSVTVSSVPSAGPDISGAWFQSLSASMATYGLSREFFSVAAGPKSMPVTPTGGTTCRAAISFKLMDAVAGGDPVPILGFTVRRSSDGFTYRDIGTLAYGALFGGPDGTHVFYDTDPEISAGKTYKYRVTAFTDGTHAKDSDVMVATVMPPFTASLAGPADQASIDAATPPSFSFSVSDPSLWDPAIADYFYFAPLIREKDGAIVFYGEFAYSLTDDILYFRSGDSFVNVVTAFGGLVTDFIGYAAGTITLKPALFRAGTNYFSGASPAYLPGVTYGWDVFGYSMDPYYIGYPAGMQPAMFYRTGSNSISRSLADTYPNGNQTLNGAFEFTAR